MPVRKKTQRDQSGITQRDVELLKRTINDGYPWVMHAGNECVSSPVDDRLDILLAHLSGVFTLAAGYPADAHPSKQTVKAVRKELADELAEAERKWGKLVPRSERWGWEDLAQTGYGWAFKRPLY